MTTTADNYTECISRTLRQFNSTPPDSPHYPAVLNEMVGIAKTFYMRVHPYEIELENFDICNLSHQVSVVFKGWHNKPIRVNYCYTKNSYELGDGNGLGTSKCSDAFVCERLGVPLSYLNGVIDALLSASLVTCKKKEAINRRESAIANVRSKLAKRNLSVRKAKQKLQQQIAEFTESECVKKEVSREAKKKSIVLRRKLATALEQNRQMRSLIDMSGSHFMPTPPQPWLTPKRKYEPGEVPEAPGVYFVWNGPVVVYVGQSTALANRIRFGSHEKIVDGDMLSYLNFEKHELMTAECFYIWRCKPVRNYSTPW